MDSNPAELVYVDTAELTRIVEDQFEQEEDLWGLVKEQPLLDEMPMPEGAVHKWPVVWLNVCNWLYECSPMIPQRVWTPPSWDAPYGDGLKDFIPFGRVVGFGEYARYGVHVSDLDRNDEYPGSFTFLENPLGSEVMSLTQNHFTLHLQWPGYEHEEWMSSEYPAPAILRLSLAAETRSFLWHVYKKMAESNLSTHLNPWHPARVPWTRLRILGLMKIADGHWQPLLYLSTEYAELPAPEEYELLRSRMHAQLIRLCAAEGRSQESAALLGNMHLKGASEELADILGTMRLGGAAEQAGGEGKIDGNQ